MGGNSNKNPQHMFALQRLGLHYFASGDEQNGLNPAMLDALQVWASLNHVVIFHVDRCSVIDGGGTGHFSAWNTFFCFGELRMPSWTYRCDSWSRKEWDFSRDFTRKSRCTLPCFFLMPGQGWCQSGHFEAKTLWSWGRKDSKKSNMDVENPVNNRINYQLQLVRRISGCHQQYEHIPNLVGIKGDSTFCGKVYWKVLLLWLWPQALACRVYNVGRGDHLFWSNSCCNVWIFRVFVEPLQMEDITAFQIQYAAD